MEKVSSWTACIQLLLDNGARLKPRLSFAGQLHSIIFLEYLNLNLEIQLIRLQYKQMLLYTALVATWHLE